MTTYKQQVILFLKVLKTFVIPYIVRLAVKGLVLLTFVWVYNNVASDVQPEAQMRYTEFMLMHW